MTPAVQISTLSLDDLRARLREMSDEKLREFGKAARYMTTPHANYGKPPHPDYVLQLAEAIAEWQRRYRKANRSE